MMKSMEMNLFFIKEMEFYDVIVFDFSVSILVFMVILGMELELDYINRIRMNTIVGV